MTMLPLAALLQVSYPQLPPTDLAFIAASLLKLLVIFTIYLVIVSLLTLAERRVAGWIQDRHGPNRAGPGGILQPVADGLKNFMKEESRPTAAYEPIFTMAPALAFIPALVTWAVIPFAAPLPTRWGLITMQLADVPIGFIFILSVASLGVYGLVLAGWSSNNKYSLLGGLRASAQLVSYEIALGMATIPVLLLAGNVTLPAIIDQQVAGWWNVLGLTLAWFIFMVAAFAETNRLPFDMPEAESELVAGYHTEYSSMKFSMFFIAEYASMITISAFMVTMFWGGWDIPFTNWDNTAPYSVGKTLLTLLAFAAKLFFFIFAFMWVRWTLPRFRYDQLMALGWKFMIPLALAYIVVIATSLLVLDAVGVPRGNWQSFALFALNLVLCAMVFWALDRGRLVSPASRPARDVELARLRAKSDPRVAAARRSGADRPAETLATEMGD
ncbi:MAG TPA: complex I subunit 1 family protein [Gemmatimonadaceae bacterium]|nr:complex I subunit 1 family protein [Gemmatimonadaceae bacterium]